MQLKKYLCLILLCFFWQTPVYAKGMPIINTGDEMFEVAPFPEKFIADYPDLQGLKAGYKCSHFGLFWADVWTWDCSLVGMNSASDDGYYELPTEITSELSNDPNYAMSKADRSLWNNYGIVLILLLIAGYAFYQFRSKN